MPVTPDNWDKVKKLFEAALDLAPSKREQFLAENCADKNLKQRVEELLHNYQEAGSFLDDPALRVNSPATNERGDSKEKDLSRLRTVPGHISSTISSTGQDAMVGRQLGAYRLVRRIGQGGMAVVYLAARADDEYHKQVAIKIVQPELDSQDLLTRFRNERQTLAGLDHPNIVKLLDGGSTSEGPFLVMDYVEGRAIDDYCDNRKLSVDQRLVLFGKVCDAVHYAHQKGVIHRDLKPGNLLVSADDTPKLLDFGIAKVLNPEPSAQNLIVTQAGARCMTPAYASPEQMRGNVITPASDIYSLGVVLYELLSGHRPYRLTQHTPAEIERAICEQDPDAPSTAVSRIETETSSTGISITITPELVSLTREGQPEKLRRRLKGDLDNIVLKALQKEPAKRYSSVEEFAKDIARHLQHLPIKARRNTLSYRSTKFVQRHGTETIAISVILFLISASLMFALNFFGLRDGVRRSGSSKAVPPLKTRQSFHPKGWVTAAAVSKPAVSCESLMNLKLAHTIVLAAHPLTADSFTPPGGDPIQHLPAFCRVESVIKPTADSDIRIEVWMPSSWNGKFLGLGNGGFGGAINYDELGPAVRNGYAAASTDTGHNGDDRDSRWALGHPEKVADLGYRAIHEMSQEAKATIRAFYGQAPQRSFFEGCSNGGREGLMEAQRFPEDYDGILAGAPAIPATRLLAAGLFNVAATPPTLISSSKIPAISAAVLAACDAQDGVVDGIISDPSKCHFNPAVLLCRGAESDSCLNPAQVSQLKKIYLGLRSSDGEHLYPGFLPGGEEGEGGWNPWLTGNGTDQPLLSVYGMNFLRNMVFENPNWDSRAISAERAITVADKKIGRIVNATDPDLRPFLSRGGKLIMYHGWSDAAMTGLTSTAYYKNVSTTVGSQETEHSIRLYMVPGLQHCYGGPGPNFFGQIDLSVLGSNAQETLEDIDPQHNIFIALEQWVIKGVAPGPIIATKYLDDLNPAQGIKMTRPLCPYPQVARYKGSGDTNDAANFGCTDNK